MEILLSKQLDDFMLKIRCHLTLVEISKKTGINLTRTWRLFNFKAEPTISEVESILKIGGYKLTIREIYNEQA
jgi:DNA-binding phage protein